MSSYQYRDSSYKDMTVCRPSQLYIMGIHIPGKTVFIKTGPRPVSIWRQIRRPRDRLIFNVGIPILVRWHLYIETVPWRLDNSKCRRGMTCFTTRPSRLYIFPLATYIGIYHAHAMLMRRVDHNECSYMAKTVDLQLLHPRGKVHSCWHEEAEISS